MYKLDFDAFRIHVKVVTKGETTEVVQTGIAEGIYSKNSFSSCILNDTVFIFNSYVEGVHYYKTEKGTTVRLSNR